MNKQRKTSHILNVFQYDADGHVVIPATLTIGENPHSSDNTNKIPSTAWVRSYVSELAYQGAITLTNTGSSGAATLLSNTLNIPTYTLAGLGGEPAITAGTTAQYWRGDKSFQTLNTTVVSEGTNLYYTDARVGSYLTANNYATQSYVGTQIANLVDAAPGTLDTLNELAAALGDDPNFATTVSTSIGTKVPQARTISINGTSYDLSADRSWTINSMVYPSAGIAISTGTAWGTSITDNSANWNTAYGWGNHASAGYLTTASAASTYVSLTGSYANPSWITSLAYSKITGVPAFLTSYTETDTLSSVTGRGASTSTAVTFSTSAIIGRVLIDYDGTDSWFRMQSGNRMRITTTGGTDFIIPNTGNMTYNGNTVWHSGNLTNLNQLSNGPGYITSYTETDTLASVTGRGSSTTTAITISSSTDQLITLNATDSSWTYLGFSWAGTRRGYFGLNASGELNIGSDYGQTFRVSGGGGMTVDGSTVLHGGTNTIPQNITLNTNADNWMWLWQASSSNSWYIGPTTANFGIGGNRLAISSSGSSPNAELVIERGNTRLLEVLQANLQYKGNVVLHAGNYTSYSPSLTGSGASGTWGIRITGFANQGSQRLYSTDSAYNYDAANPYFGYLTYDGTYWQFKVSPASPDRVRVYTADTLGGASANQTGGANTIVQRDSNGYIQNSYFYTSGGGAERGTGISYIAGFNSSDYYIRSYTLQGLASAMSGVTMNISGNATTANGANGNFYIDDNYGNTVVGVYASTRYQGVFAMGDSYKLPADGTSTGNLYGLAWSHPNAGGIAGNLNTHGLLVMENGTFLAAISGNIKARDGIIAGTYMYAPNYIESSGPMYGTIFYDNNNRTYFFDGDGQTRAYRVNLSDGQVQAANNAGGRLRISSWTNGESVINGNTHNIVLGPYSTRTGASLYYAGIAINGLLNYGGGTSYDVAPHIWIGGYYRDTPGSERSDFVVAIKSGTGTSGAGSDLPEPRFRVDYEGIASATGSFRAPIFYDSNNTGYYLDPDSTSRLYATRYDYIGVGQAINTSYRIITNGDYYANGGGNFWAEGRFKQYRASGTWHDVIDSGNIGSQSVNYANYSDYSNLIAIPDWRDTSYSPNTYAGNRVGWHFNNVGQNGGPAGDYWGAMQTVSPWSSFNTSHRQMQLWWGGSAGLSYRYAVGSGYDPTGWSGWERVMTSSNAPYAWNMNQYVRTSDSVSFSTVSGSDVYTTGGWFRNHTNTNGIYWSTTGWHLMPADSVYFRIHSGSSSEVALRMETNGTTRGYIYADNSNNIGFLNTSAAWRFRVDNGGRATMYGPIARNSHSTGFLEGSYNNVGGNSYYTNPIYTIGSSYNPTDSSLQSMYGIGYSHPNFWGSGKTPSWGLYVCEGGTINATIGGGSTTIWAQNDIVAYSDARVKDNIEVVENAVEKIQAIRGVTFTRTDANDKDRNKRHAGVIAQEVLKVLPEVVSGTEEDMYSVAYGNMAALFIEAIKEQQKQIEELQNKLDNVLSNR